MSAYRTAEGLIKSLSAATMTDEDRWDIAWVLDVYESCLGSARDAWATNKINTGSSVPASWFRKEYAVGEKNVFTIPPLATIAGVQHVNVKGTNGCNISYIFSTESEYNNALALDCNIKEKTVILRDGSLRYMGSTILDRVEVEAVWARASMLSTFNPMFDDFPMDTSLQFAAEEMARRSLFEAAKKKPDTTSDGKETTVTM